MLWAPNGACLHLSAVFFSFFLDTSEKLKKKNRQRVQAPNHWVLQDSMPVSKFIYVCKKKTIVRRTEKCAFAPADWFFRFISAYIIRRIIPFDKQMFSHFCNSCILCS